MRKSYIFDEKLQKLVPKEEYFVDNEGRGVLVCGDLPDVISPIDGKVIHGRAGMREHNRRHGVTFTEDFKDQWAKAAKDRAAVFEGKSDKTARLEAVRRNFDRLGGYRPGSRNDFQT